MVLRFSLFRGVWQFNSPKKTWTGIYRISHCSVILSLYSLVNAFTMPPLNKKVFLVQVHQRSFESWQLTNDQIATELQWIIDCSTKVIKLEKLWNKFLECTVQHCKLPLLEIHPDQTFDLIFSLDQLLMINWNVQ